MRSRPLALPVLVWLALLGVAGLAYGDEFEEFELAKSRYDVGNYPEAATRFAVLVDPKAEGYLKDQKLRQQARVLYAATLVALDRPSEADALIATVLREEPAYQPAPGLFPQEVIDRFIAVRAELRAELEAVARAQLEAERRKEQERAQARAAEAKRVAELERMASEERTVESRSRWIALLPFGVGQFQNESAGLGWFFLVSETLTATASIVSGAIAYDYASVACGRPVIDPDTGEQAEVDCDRLTESFETARAVNWITFGSTAALAIAGIIEAQVAFEEQSVVVRKRELPAPVRIVPAASATEQGAWLGLVGWF